MTELRTGYAVLKDMFDCLALGTPAVYINDNITNIYRDAFGVRISHLPKYTYGLRVLSNPINRIIMFSGQEDTNLLTGIIPSMNGIYYMACMEKQFEYGINKNNIEDYIRFVYNTIYDVVSKDRFITCGPKEPYGIFVRACPFYLTFHHIWHVAANVLNEVDEHIFDKYISKFVKNDDDIATVLQSISGEEYDPTFEEICRVVSCGNKVEFM